MRKGNWLPLVASQMKKLASLPATSQVYKHDIDMWMYFRNVEEAMMAAPGAQLRQVLDCCGRPATPRAYQDAHGAKVTPLYALYH